MTGMLGCTLRHLSFLRHLLCPQHKVDLALAISRKPPLLAKKSWATLGDSARPGGAQGSRIGCPRAGGGGSTKGCVAGAASGCGFLGDHWGDRAGGCRFWPRAVAPACSPPGALARCYPRAVASARPKNLLYRRAGGRGALAPLLKTPRANGTQACVHALSGPGQMK